MASDALGDPSLLHQTLVLLWKNVLLKWRRKWNTLLDWIQDVIFVLVIYHVATISRYDTTNEFGPASTLGRLDEFPVNVTVVYMSGTSDVRGTMQRLNRSSRGLILQEFQDEELMLKHIVSSSVIGLEFEDPFKYRFQHYFMALPSANSDMTYHGECHDGSEHSCYAAHYWKYGFLYLQAKLDSDIIEVTTGKSVGDTLTSIKAMKMKSMQRTWWHKIVVWMFVFLMCLSFMSLTCLLSLYITRERQEMLEIMRVMRMRALAFWLSWGILYTFPVIVIANILTLLATRSFLSESSYIAILLLFTLYGLASVSFSFLLCTIIRKPRVTVFVGFLTTFLISMFGLLLLVRHLPKAVEVLLCIFHPFAFTMGLLEVLHLEREAQGAFFSDMAGDSFQILCSYISLALDTIFYMILTLYFEKVLPDKHGLKHDPLFFTRSSFWRKEKWIPTSTPSARQREPESIGNIESAPSSLLGKEAIRIHNVKKTYMGQEGIVEALNGLEFDVYEGQITALLGHSRAGKTTLLNVLSGMCPATSGTASIYSYNLSDRSNVDELRRISGFCPRHDVKFDQLTVKENFKIFAQIKGIPSCRTEHEVKKVMSYLQLTDVQNKEAEALNDGQRRKLTLGIALLGDPKVLLLDEPTAGLDSYSRHQVWALLKEMKENRVTLISTQSMDEADVLADRKAVLSVGRLKCLGSSQFLKRKWGIGCHLRMHITSSCDPEAIRTLIQQHIPTATLSNKRDQEITFTLPVHSMEAFPDLLSHLEQQQSRDIVSYGVSMMSLDDVFRKLEGEQETGGGYRKSSHEEREDRSSEAEDSIQVEAGRSPLSDWALWKLQVLAVARMRYLKLKYDRRLFWTILVILICYLTPFIFLKWAMNHLSTRSWELTPKMYFLTTGERESRSYSRLLICNNTGFPIEDFTEAVKSQDIAITVTNGPFQPDTIGYKGAIEVTRGKEGYRYVVIGNFMALNSLPVLVNIISNSMLKMFNSDKHIRIWRETVDYEFFAFEQNSLYESMYYLIFAAALVPHFAMSSNEDTRIKARSQLHISGLFPSAYWCGQALVDIPFHWTLISLMIAILFLFNTDVVFSFWLVCLMILEIIGYGAAIVLYAYVIAFLFRNGKGHHDWWSFFFFMTPVLRVFFWMIMYEDFVEAYILPLLFPASNLMQTLYQILYTHMDEMLDPQHIDVTSLCQSISMTYLLIVLFSGMLWCLEWRYGSRSLKRDPLFRTSKIKNKINPNPEDLDDAHEEVLAERERVKAAKTTQQEEEPAIIVSSLHKEFTTRSVASCHQKKNVATKNISFCVRKGEILGLLGPNGAGKTTTLSMIAGELIPTAGEVQLCEAVSPMSSSDTIGFCCQDSPLWPDVTVWEHLDFYASIKGTTKENVDMVVRRIIEALDLKDHLHKPANKLSTDVSRKVCLAIGMLGDPTIMLLDEPTTGIDPKGRKEVWKPLREAIRNKQKAAILTTHNMDDAEAVCDRVAIMVSGKLLYIGSIQQMKDTFGKGYQLEIKVKDSQRAEVLHQDVIRMFPQAARQERFSSSLVYNIPMDDIQSLSKAFLQLEEAKRVHNMEEYSFSQPTLEQVFQELMREQEMEEMEGSPKKIFQEA